MSKHKHAQITTPALTDCAAVMHNQMINSETSSPEDHYCRYLITWQFASAKRAFEGHPKDVVREAVLDEKNSN